MNNHNYLNPVARINSPIFFPRGRIGQEIIRFSTKADNSRERQEIDKF